MRRIKWWLRGLSQNCFPKFTLAILAHRTWVLEPEVALIPLLSRRKGVAVDAGANKGVFLYHFARHYQRVLGFEPLPQLATYLQNAAPPNATVHALALSDAEGIATLRLPKGLIELGSLEAHTAETWTTTAEVETHDVQLKSLDSFDLAQLDLFKIDVEGHELTVLEGARETLQRCKPTILVEVEERHRAGGVHQLCTQLEELGYAGFFLDGLRLRSVGDFDLGRDQNVASLENSVKVSRYINNFIFFPRNEAAGRVAAIRRALEGRTKLELAPALVPGHAVTLRERFAGPLYAVRDVLFAPGPLVSPGLGSSLVSRDAP